MINFYTQPAAAVVSPGSLLSFLNRYPLLLIIIFFILFSLKNLYGFLVARNQYRFVYSVASRLSEDNLRYYLNSSYKNYVNVDSSVHIRKISDQPIQFGHHVLSGLQQITSQVILILFSITAILVFNPVLFPLLFLILTPPIILTGILLKKKFNSIREAAKPANEKRQQYLQEALSGFIESNIYDSSEFFIRRYYAFQAKFNNFLSEQLVLQNLPSRFIEVFAIFGLFVLILIKRFDENANAVQLITIGAFMAAAYKIIPGIVKILNSIGQIKTYGYTVGDLLQNNNEPLISKTKKNESIRSVEFANVSFSYNGEKVLSGFYLKTVPGDFVGLSGVSGKGKTTVINLLLGFLHPSSGNILINGNSTNTDERQSYWSNIAYVKQQTFLIHDSICKNIIFNERDEDTERLKKTAAVTGIDNIPGGLKKLIAENGKNISGGQRQRIAIARALYKNADLIILDEPFNELDEDSELKLVKHFRQLTDSGKIVILITHNKDSLSYCDKIISLDEA